MVPFGFQIYWHCDAQQVDRTVGARDDDGPNPRALNKANRLGTAVVFLQLVGLGLKLVRHASQSRRVGWFIHGGHAKLCGGVPQVDDVL